MNKEKKLLRENILKSIKNKDINSSYKLLSKLKKEDVENPQFLILQGIFFVEINDLVHSLAAFSKAAQKMPRDPTLLYNLSVLLEQMGRLNASEEAIHRAMHVSKPNPFIYFQMAEVLTLQGKHPEAMKTLFKCIEQFGLFFPAYVALVYYLLLLDHKDLAIQLYEKAIEAAPKEKFFKVRLAELKAL